MSPSVETRRLFVALWPDAAVRARLAAFSGAWHWPAGARRVDAANLHVTLHFIGAFALDREDALAARLAAVAPRRVELRPTGWATWHGGIVVLTFAPAPALAALHREVGDALADLGIALETRAFRPHVTLARKAEGAVPPGDLPGLGWRAEGFSLVESAAGHRCATNASPPGANHPSAPTRRRRRARHKVCSFRPFPLNSGDRLPWRPNPSSA